MSDQKTRPSCPICDKDVASRTENPAFPFCSKRCKSEDLGKWLGGNYVVAGRPANPHEIADQVRSDSD